MNTLDKLYLRAQLRARIMKDNVKEFMKEEHGVSNIVATIILLLIVVLLIGIFWEKLGTWLNSVMDKVFDEGALPTKDNFGGSGGE